MNIELIEKNHEYWMNRAPGYSEVNQEELSGVQRKNWSYLLESEISNKVKGKEKDEIKILDIGCGPGFFSIILTELGYCVTAVDFAENMIEKAKKNAGSLAEKIIFLKQDAQNLEFKDESFDVIVSRNLTWNLPDPKKAYEEWIRVLKPGGILLVFDANWYSYLFDEEKRAGYEADRKNVADLNLEDYNIGENFDVMEEIAKKVPLSRENRPKWDIEVLTELGIEKAEAVNNIGKQVYSEKELINYASTPLFMIKGEKSSNG